MSPADLFRSAYARREARIQYERRIRDLCRTEDALHRVGRAGYEVHGAIVILDRSREQELHAAKFNGEGWW